MRILFQGDSITDAGRDRSDCHNMGYGYPLYSKELIEAAFPEAEIEFFNFGISGNRTCQLFDRLYLEGISQEPDVISIMIGINDIWHRYGHERITTTDEQIATNYRAILTRLKKETTAKIIILSPYVLDHESAQHLRPDLARILPIVRELAKELADAYIPLDELFDEAVKTQPSPCHYSGDGVHPNENGARFIAQHYLDAIAPILRSLA